MIKPVYGPKPEPIHHSYAGYVPYCGGPSLPEIKSSAEWKQVTCISCLRQKKGKKRMKEKRWWVGLAMMLVGCGPPQIKCEQVYNREMRDECEKRNACARSQQDPQVCFPEPWKHWLKNGRVN